MMIISESGRQALTAASSASSACNGSARLAPWIVRAWLRCSCRAVSAVDGRGIEALRETLAKQVAEEAALRARLAADVSVARPEPERIGVRHRQCDAAWRRCSIDQLTKQVAIAAGVPVRHGGRRQGMAAAGWPGDRLARAGLRAKFKPDPLRRLHLDRSRRGVGGVKEIIPRRSGGTSLPATSGVQQARVDTAVRALA